MRDEIFNLMEKRKQYKNQNTTGCTRTHQHNKTKIKPKDR